MLVDRHEDVTHPSLIDDDEECERSMTFYGYVRGTHLKPGMRVHLIGLGDYNMEDVTVLPDPCPLPDKELEQKVSHHLFLEKWEVTRENHDSFLPFHIEH